MIYQIFAAVAGTIAFSVLYDVPDREFPYCGLTGGLGWFTYLLFSLTGSTSVAVLTATMVVVLTSRILAVRRRCPVTIFLIAGIFPLVPGAGVYQMVYYLVSNRFLKALGYGYDALKCAIAIVLGIVFIFELPQSLFTKASSKKK